jgi:hypothetical protein
LSYVAGVALQVLRNRLVLVARVLVAVAGVLVLCATSAPRAAMIQAPTGAGKTDESGRATIVVVISGAALETTTGSTMRVTATAEDGSGTPAGSVRRRGTGVAAGNRLHAECLEMEREDEDDCRLVFDADYERAAHLEVHVELISGSTAGFPFNGNGSFEEGASVRVEVR